ncbi:ski oncogene-like [Paramacrobiotus metropolitanus]|uniref:ski oncogene-like n=1 Tax=Paramacrobiotus metropolitanus TaxID=2943436 RepID=UPI00244572E6|nr:ski oncogene-like [Paramacrobiotus metropolitanus]XP_055339992.1 ski oncogene-like [Paramacrobiotus metropolitanus]
MLSSDHGGDSTMSSNSGTKSPTALITNPHLKKVLKTYAQTAMSSLSGPGSFQNAWSTSDGKMITTSTSTSNTSGGRAVIHPPTPSSIIKSPKPVGRKDSVSDKEFIATAAHQPPFPIQPAPIFFQPEQTSSERSETIFEGHNISYFCVGGEKRLCLPQLLNTVLSTRSLEEINAVCEELRIYLPQCTGAQLDCLKASTILPSSAPSCGLITLTDAERLCGALMHRKPDHRFQIANREKCRHFPIVHRSFGEIRGECFLDLYVNPDAPCIECQDRDCRGLFSPRHFVVHTHPRSMEQGVCHWGFDSARWRHYVLIPEEEEIGQDAHSRCRVLLEELKSKSFDDAGNVQTKRTMSFSGKIGSDDEHARTPSKRIKIEEAIYPHGGGLLGPVAWYIPQFSRSANAPPGLITSPNDLSAKFTTQAVIPVNNVAVDSPNTPQIPAYLNHGPPIIVNPERIILASTYEKDDEKLQPNVALVPPVTRPKSVIQRKAEPVTAVSTTTSTAFTSIGRRCGEADALGSMDCDNSCMPSTSSRDQGPDAMAQAPSATPKKSGTARSESDDETSSSSTLSIDFCQESAILEEDEEDLNGVLQFVDTESRGRIVQGIKRLKQRYGSMLLQAQHDKNNLEKDLQYYKVIRKEKVRDLKVALSSSQQECSQLRHELAKKVSEVERLHSDKADMEVKVNNRDTCLSVCVAEKELLLKHNRDLETENETLKDQLKALKLSSEREKPKSPPTTSKN